MNKEKEKQFRLILTNPKERYSQIIAEGSEDFCNSKRLELETEINTAYLSIEAVNTVTEEDEKRKNETGNKINWGGIITIALLGFLGWLLDKTNKNGAKK